VRPCCDGACFIGVGVDMFGLGAGSIDCGSSSMKGRLVRAAFEKRRQSEASGFLKLTDD
jgi:hypothetical protein